jgi:hypothetical protein
MELNKDTHIVLQHDLQDSHHSMSNVKNSGEFDLFQPSKTNITFQVCVVQNFCAFHVSKSVKKLSCAGESVGTL